MGKKGRKHEEENENTEKEGDSSDEEQQSTGSSVFSKVKSKLKRFKRNKKKKGAKRPRKTSTNTTGKTTDEVDSSEEEEFSARDSDFEDARTAEKDAVATPQQLNKIIESGDKAQTVFVTVRLIEARDVRCGGSLRARAGLDGRQKATRVTTELHPKWRQNINFSLDTTIDKAATKTLTVQLFSVRRVLTDQLIGEWECSLGTVMHQPQSAVISKWVALSPPASKENNAGYLENCGFLKVSLAVYGKDVGPPIMEDDDTSEDIFHGAHLNGFTLRIRLFRFQQLGYDLLQIGKAQEKIKKQKKYPRFTIRAIIGDFHGDTSAERLDDELIPFNQEIYIPFLWPTVVNKITFQLLVKRGRRQKIAAQSSIPFTELYAAGECGFMPQFGPAFVNYFGSSSKPRFRLFRDKHTIMDGERSDYFGRILTAIECIEYQGEQSEKTQMSYAALQYSKNYERYHHYTLYCSFFACNLIHPRYASDSIQFLVSLGDCGSLDPSAVQIRTSTLPTMPDYDDCKYFYMPWGNHKPIAHIECLLEDVQHRIERRNAILKVAEMLDQLLEEAAALGAQSTEAIGSVAVEALELACHMISLVENHHCPSKFSSELDFLSQESRKETLKHIYSDLIVLKYEALKLSDAGEETIRALARTSESLKKLSRDPEMSIPDLAIKMRANNKVVGYARVNAADIYYSDTESLSGLSCGKVKEVPMRWVDNASKKSLKDEVPCVLHLRMWLGRKRKKNRFAAFIQPAEQKTFFEIYHYQKLGAVSSEWKSVGYSSAADDPTEGGKKLPEIADGWNVAGFWAIRNTHDRWISSDLGRVLFDDKLFELQRREGEKWKFDNFTDIWGAAIARKDMEKPPKGWVYDGDWSVDLLSPGDKEGWVYSVSGEFNGDGVDKEMRITHMFRRRVLKRTRRKEKTTEETNQQDLTTFEQSMGADDGWEYARKKNGVFHDKKMSDDKLRRRRFVVNVNKAQENLSRNFYITREFEVHDTVSQWQMRAYIFWAKDLLPLTDDFSSRAFVRVSYLHMTKQTLIIDKTANPVFNETLIFDKLLIPGAHQTITECPPAVLVEVKGERHADSECFLGRFYVRPTVICGSGDKRARMKWHTLKFGPNKTRGAILCAFELFLRDVNRKVDLPLVPAKKQGSSSAIEVPAELRPKFKKYSIQLLCWGLRNLGKHNLLSIRKPYVDLVFGDAITKTSVLEDVRRNPNFPEPLIIFDDVQLPEELHLAPPLVMNLHDTRAFRSKPLIGVCIVSNYKQYVRKASVQKQEKKASEDVWKVFDEWFADEEDKDADLVSQLRDEFTSEESSSQLSEYRIDWWSKYYSSTGKGDKAPGFEKSGIEKIRVFDWALEDTAEYRAFKDFLDTFDFKKSARGQFDDREEKEVKGQMKGRLFIREHVDGKPQQLAMPPGIEFTGVVHCTVRVYVIAAKNLIIADTKHACDSYIVATIGKDKIARKKDYRPDNVDPEYGEMIEFDVDIPLQKDLRLAVMNRRMLLRDEEIGSTTIDLENRLLTKFRATVGLNQQYTVAGELTWRDQMSPLAILRRYCRRMDLPPPEVLSRQKEKREKAAGGGGGGGGGLTPTQTGSKSDKQTKSDNEQNKSKSDKDVGLKVLGVEFWLSDIERTTTINPTIVGRPAQRVALFVLHKMGLVPEHVESRPLFHGHGGKQEVGRLQCWVDILPAVLGNIPAAIDVSVRQPEKYQLRLAVMNVLNAIVCKRSFGQPSGDLYIKAFLNGHQKGQKTDVHYRVTDGFGSFNYRLIIDFDFNPWERKIYAKEKSRFLRKSRPELVEPLLILQLWDNNKFKKDSLLGEMVIDLMGFQEGLMDPDEISEVYYPQMRKKSACRRSCVSFWKIFCNCCCGCCSCCKEEKKGKQVVPLPKAPVYIPPAKDAPLCKPFEQMEIRGHWPVLMKGKDLPNDQKIDYAARKKKNDDLGVEADKEYVMGVIEMDMSLLTYDEAMADKVGKKRKKPNHSPFLPKPERSKWDSNWCLSRIRPGLRWFWSSYGSVILVWILIIVLLVIVVGSLVYNFPTLLFQILFGK